eukprot:CAMPEP_0171199896 /NCGR_PEP_ID=MMETSP0790-20130122/23703_1 /TAXON_ID=2925 /ORGANISM="Alexandrium catenella, Strain OF101" /LENGTH=67 /DNA_ID=CAMNT_0011665263 /DNA_START=59 /DNA_END=258 /DNA_ORIENTATION=-
MACERPTSYSIHKVKGASWQSSFLVLNLLGNCGCVLFSHLGLSFEVFTNLPPAGADGGGSGGGSGGG